MRLRSQKNQRSPSQQRTSPPPRSQTTAAVSPAYHTAYSRGFVPGPDGQFDHFVRTVDEDHMQRGYWRFSTYEDDRMAYALGFWTPEDVLVAQDRTEESYNGISLRWVRGMNETNMKPPLVGSPAQHLQTLYEVRQVLGMPMSLRGQIPVYPISQDARLQQYWERKVHQQSLTLDPTPALSPITRTWKSNTESSLSQSQQPDLGPQHTNGSFYHDNSLADNSRHSKGFTGASGNSGRPNTPRRPTVSPITPKRVLTPVTGPIDTGHESLPTRQSPSGGRSNRPRSRQGQTPQLENPIGSSVVQQQVNAPAAIQFQSSISAQSSRQALGSTYPADASGYQHPSSYCVSSVLSRPLSRDSTSAKRPPYVSHTDLESTLQLPSPYATSGFSNLPGNADQRTTHKPHLHAPIDPSQLRQQLECTASSDESQFNPSEEDTSSTLYPSVGSIGSANTQDNVQTTDRASIAEAGSKSQEKLTPFSDELVHDSKQKDIASAQASPETFEEFEGTSLHHQQYEKDDEIENLPSNENQQASDIYSMLPCMDCGEDDGHKWDCHIGNIKPMDRLTALDYRNLAEAVERFDPGPWTTHFNQFREAAPEDPEEQIRGMAEVIRNEDSYKNDTQLHGLSDDTMIMLWALKTSAGAEVIEG
ncbi:Nn.00g070300.m01.CDS01 [Neocucurbitaria sp. VM-36]